MSLIIPPAFIFFLGIPILLLKGVWRKIGLIILAVLALIFTFSLQPGTYYTYKLMSYDLILLNVDKLSLFIGYIFTIITFFAVLYATTFNKPWLYLFALLYAGASLGAVFAGDFITLIIFWEIMSLTSTTLVWIHGGDAISAGYRYLLFHVIAGSLLLGGVVIQYLSTGNLLVGASITNSWALLLITLAVGINLGFIPLHTWLPDTYPKPHIATSVFLSVYTTKAAVYLLARIATGAIFMGTEIIALMGGIMAVYGVCFALMQNNMRKLLSYHIISQIGYMVAGVGLGIAIGINGGMAHAFNNILYKTLLFMCVGSVIYRTGIEKISQIGGLWKKMHVTALTFIIAMLSISGIPGFNGFVSKGMIITASENFTILWILLEIASVGTLLSFLKLGYFVFFREWKDVKISEVPISMQLAQIGVAILCVIIGIYPNILFSILPFQNQYIPYSFSYIIQASVILGLTAIFFFTIGKKILIPHDPTIKDFDVLYRAFGNGILTLSGIIVNLFSKFYIGTVNLSSMLFSVSRGFDKIENKDINWNMIAFAILLVLIIGIMLVVV